MLLLVSGATATVQRHAGDPYLGRFIQPECWNDLIEFARCDMDKAADNNCLQGFNVDKYLAMCDALQGAHRLRFVAAPDAVSRTSSGIVGDWNGTLWLFRHYAPALRRRGLPTAIVLQDGATVDTVPWDEIDALFVGGSDAWKLSGLAALLMRVGKAREKWIHVGRVNSFERATKVDTYHVDSIDGGQFSMFPDTHIPRYLEWLATRQMGLDGHAYVNRAVPRSRHRRQSARRPVRPVGDDSQRLPLDWPGLDDPRSAA